MDIDNFHLSLLRAGSMAPDAEGLVDAVQGDKRAPKLIDGKRLVFPNAVQLANPNWDDRVAFGPLGENILRAESPVLEALRKAMNITVNLKASALAFELLVLAASQSRHASLNPDQAEFLTKMNEPGEKDVAFFKSLLKEMPFDKPSQSMTSFYLKRGGSVGGKRHARVGVVSFPLYAELTAGNPKVFGVKPSSNKVRENVIALLDYIIPNQGVAEAYNRGSDSRVAPFLDSLMRAYIAVAQPLNDTIELFRDVLEDPDALLLESEFVDAIDELDKLSMLSVKLKGNEGAVIKDGNETPAPEAPKAPGQAPAPAGNLTMADINKAQQQQLAPVNGLQNQWPQVNQQPAPVLGANKGGGISFADIARVNPTVGGGLMPMPQGNLGGYNQGYHPQQQSMFPQNNYGMVPNNTPPGVMPGSGVAVGGTNFGNNGYPQQNNYGHMPQQNGFGRI